MMPPRQKTRKMLRIAEGLDESASRLAALLNADRIPAIPVPLYLPVMLADGRVQGIVRLKHIAVAGKLGKLGVNSVLFNPRYGPRLLLSGVVTGTQVTPDPQDNSGKTSDPDGNTMLCTGCGHCIMVCPGGAIQQDRVDTFRCRTIGAWIPPPLIPAAKFLLGRRLLLKGMAPLAPWIARTATIRCSLCVTECPKFSAGRENGRSRAGSDDITRKADLR